MVLRLAESRPSADSGGGMRGGERALAAIDRLADRLSAPTPSKPVPKLEKTPSLSESFDGGWARGGGRGGAVRVGTDSDLEDDDLEWVPLGRVVAAVPRPDGGC